MAHFLKTTLFLALPLSLGACGSMLLDLNGSSGAKKTPSLADDSQSSQGRADSSEESPSSASAGSSGVDYFAGLTDEENQKNARELKQHLREGQYRFTRDGASFARVEAICGTKLWDTCDVAELDEKNDIGWNAYAFRVKGQDKIYRLPELVYDLAVPVWSARIWEQVAAGPIETRQALLSMLKDKCGHPVDTKCTVRELEDSDKYRMTVNSTSEEILVPDTISEWRNDL